MNISRLHGSGAWQIYALVDGYFKTRTFYGYTRSEAIELWQEEFGIDDMDE